MNKKNKPGEAGPGQEGIPGGPEDGTEGRTLSATPSLVERQSRFRNAQSSIRLGEKFGDYQILRLLGKGGMGEVYEAEHLESGRRVALKILADSLGSSEDRARFLQEGKLAAQVNHPNCVYVYGSEEILGIPVISMELVPGGTLKDLLKKEGRLSPERAVDLILQIVNGLEAMYSTGVLHRDIKPSNAFLDAEGIAKIGDFGLSISTLARPEYERLTRGSFAGTPVFASPEQIRGEELDVRSDIYSVGATLYCLLTGRVPFDEPDLMRLVSRILENTPDSPGSVSSGIPEGLSRAVMRCLEKKPASRFSGYAELKKGLRPYSSAALEPASPWLRINAAVLDLVVLAGLVLLGGSALAAFFSLGKEGFLYTGGVLFIVYFTVLEGLLGTTVGKTLRKIRVIGPERDSPGFPRSLGRALIIFAIVIVSGRLAGEWLSGLPLGEGLHESRLPIAYLFYPVLAGLLFVTARRRNGWAAIHDFVSGTRVVTVPPAVDEAVDLPSDTVSVPGTGRTIGPYVVVESLWKNPQGELALGYDMRLKRKIWIHTQPPDVPPLPESRCDVSRRGRLRWINGKRTSEGSWDAYEAPEGKPAFRRDSDRNSWIRVRTWLLDVIEEIRISIEEASLPSILGLDRIWITPKGRIKLLDFSAPDISPGTEVPESVRTSGDPGFSRNVRVFLKRFALFALEGFPRGLEDADKGIPSIPLPLQARSFIEGLTAAEESSLGELAGLLRSWIGRPDDLSKFRLKRLGSILASLAGLAGLDMLALLPKADLGWGIALGYLGILSSVSAFANRGGFCLTAMNLAVVNKDGSPVSRLRALSRSLVGWAPMILLGILPSLWNKTLILDSLAPDKISGLKLPLWPSLGLLIVSFTGAVWAVLTPERGPHDKIAGTYLVPR